MFRPGRNDATPFSGCAACIRASLEPSFRCRRRRTSHRRDPFEIAPGEVDPLAPARETHLGRAAGLGRCRHRFRLLEIEVEFAPRNPGDPQQNPERFADSRGQVFEGPGFFVHRCDHVDFIGRKQPAAGATQRQVEADRPVVLTHQPPREKSKNSPMGESNLRSRWRNLRLAQAVRCSSVGGWPSSYSTARWVKAQWSGSPSQLAMASFSSGGASAADYGVQPSRAASTRSLQRRPSAVTRG